MSAIILDGAIVHYEALGRGRPIVFLHGWIGSWRYWINAMQVVSTSFRAYALDLFGFGDTAREPQRYSLERQAALIDQFLNEMGIGKIAIVGHGLGALVGFWFASQWPRSVDRIMAVNCPLHPNSLHSRLQTASLNDLVDWLGSRTPEYNTALADALKADPKAIPPSIEGLSTNNFFVTVRQLGIPTLLVYGQNDPLVTMPTFDESMTLPLMIQQIVLEDTGHFPMIDQPVRFNRLLTDFLALDSGMSPHELQLKEEWKRRVR
jgi:pimeloyl-ACP methyl ester carboxylesterase